MRARWYGCRHGEGVRIGNTEVRIQFSEKRCKKGREVKLCIKSDQGIVWLPLDSSSPATEDGLDLSSE